MLISEDRNSDPTTEDMEQEDKVNVEEACVNLACVKKELEEEELEFEHKQYKIALTFENVFGESSTEQKTNRDSLIGFLDGDVIMETGSVKLEDVKEESKDFIRKTIKQSHCNKCGGNYHGYCVNCSSLSHILNNLTPNLNPELVLNTTPINMFEIREVSSGCAVFALKTLPKGIILGPFEGITPIESTTGLQWKIKNKKLVNDQNGNWMKYIDSVPNTLSRNLDVFQIDGILYFETSRAIQEGEELLVCYREEKEEVFKSDKEEAFYFVPVKREEYPKVFACTLCCLGFRLESCLLEHKSKYPQGDHGGSIEDFEIIQCRCCKVWLEKEEYLKSHMLHCLENYNRSSRNRNSPDFAPTTTDNEEQVHENDEITTSIDANASYTTLPIETIDSKNWFSRTEVHKEEYFHDKKNMGTTHSNTNNLRSRLGTHTKHFQCGICKRRFGRKDNLQMHIKNKHSTTNEKEYKCSECLYQTNYKGNLKKHLETMHSNPNEKEYKCSECSFQTNYKGNLKKHLGIHSNPNEKEYKCSAYQTNHKSHLKAHTGDKQHFQCEICKQRFSQKCHLKLHIKNKHSNTNEKEYKCFECSFQTNYKSNFKVHLGTHSDVKHFQCEICKQRFGQKGNLIMHIKNKHSNPNKKEYKCSECSYQTNYKGNFKKHLGIHSNPNEKEYKCSKCPYQTNRKGDLNVHFYTHTGIKNFECDICKQRFGQKSSLKVHIKDKHSNTNEKEYKCSECSYQTNYKSNFKVHLGTHTDVKHFQCDICQQRFAQKRHLKVHIKNQHSNTNEKDYKCSECSYQTNLKANLKSHLVSHMDVKNFQCDICKRRFGRKSHLNVHIKNKHSNTNEKEYK